MCTSVAGYGKKEGWNEENKVQITQGCKLSLNKPTCSPVVCCEAAVLMRRNSREGRGGAGLLGDTAFFVFVSTGD